MVEPLSCRYCKSNFKDGDFVACDIQGRLFHSIVRHLDREPKSCLDANVINEDYQDGIIMKNAEVYYNGRLYNYNEINKLSDAYELTLDFNDSNNGDKLVGNLEGLDRGNSILPKLTFDERIRSSSTRS